MPSRIADPKLTPEGEKAFRWAWSHMGTLTRTIESFQGRKPLSGVRLGVCLHVTKETSVLVEGLRRLGGEVHLCAANPLSTQDSVAAYLDSTGMNVYAWRGETPEEYFSCIRTVLEARPEVIMDDGSDAHAMAHSEGFSTEGVRGGTEETTTGVIRLRALESSGKLQYPIIAINNAFTKYLFDNRFGTGQSTIDGILRATSLLIAGKRVVVCGYGWVGKGIARRAKGLDANVIVTEVDPLKALEAHVEGFSVMPMSEAAKVGDIFVTATGQTGVIRVEHIQEMKDGVILANAGHFDVEIDIRALGALAREKREVRPYLEEFVLPDGRRVYLIAKGRVANLVAAEGHPPEVMSMSFSNQLLSAVYLVEKGDKLQKRLQSVPDEIDRRVALNTLVAWGIRIDEPTTEQIDYAKSWLV